MRPRVWVEYAMSAGSLNMADVDLWDSFVAGVLEGGHKCCCLMAHDGFISLETLTIWLSATASSLVRTCDSASLYLRVLTTGSNTSYDIDVLCKSVIRSDHASTPR